MSWDVYIKNLLDTKKVIKAGIYGHDGSKWAPTDNLGAKPAEVKALFAGFSNPANIQAQGVIVHDTKFLVVKADDHCIYTKKGVGGLACIKTNQTILIGEYGDGIVPSQCTTEVEKIGDYLIENGY